MTEIEFKRIARIQRRIWHINVAGLIGILALAAGALYYGGAWGWMVGR